MMAISKEELHTQLMQHFPNAQIEISSFVDDDNHYTLEITDSIFNDLSLIKQHRLVKDALKELLSGPLHAITIKTHKTNKQ